MWLILVILFNLLHRVIDKLHQFCYVYPSDFKIFSHKNEVAQALDVLLHIAWGDGLSGVFFSLCRIFYAAVFSLIVPLLFFFQRLALTAFSNIRGKY
jgi:hypothetical protein